MASRHKRHAYACADCVEKRGIVARAVLTVVIAAGLTILMLALWALTGVSALGSGSTATNGESAAAMSCSAPGAQRKTTKAFPSPLSAMVAVEVPYDPDSDDPILRAGCRIIINLVPLTNEGFGAEAIVVRLPPEGERDPEDWEFDLGYIKSFEPGWALAAAAATVAPWAERSATIDRAKARRGKRQAERQRREADAPGNE